jgi:hypothetical protein
MDIMMSPSPLLGWSICLLKEAVEWRRWHTTECTVIIDEREDG